MNTSQISSDSSTHPHVTSDTKHGPYTPTLILHGGAGSITRSNLPPSLYNAYRSSLLEYLQSAHSKLKSGASALDAACHAVSLMEDNPLFNCGRGAVFTEKGTIELEASVMVSSVSSDSAAVPVKRGVGVSLIKGTRHPILLAREALLAGGDGMGSVGTMHSQLSGEDVEQWGWKERGLERKDIDWFWTEKRWKEHLRGLKQRTNFDRAHLNMHAGADDESTVYEEQTDPKPGCETYSDSTDDQSELPSQGTVGAVSQDSWGNLAVATSTGGLTNKKAGRIGDTPTLGAGFWAESWNEEVPAVMDARPHNAAWTTLEDISRVVQAGLKDIVRDCLPVVFDPIRGSSSSRHQQEQSTCLLDKEQPKSSPQLVSHYPASNSHYSKSKPSTRRRAVAMSGTGNGDSFLRTSAVRTAAAMCRFDPVHPTLAQTVTAVAGPGGELQQSAGDRWRKTFEGHGGIISIELYNDRKQGDVVFDFNCGGMWRAWIDGDTGKPRVMVFKDEYEEQIGN